MTKLKKACRNIHLVLEIDDFFSSFFVEDFPICVRLLSAFKQGSTILKAKKITILG